MKNFFKLFGIIALVAVIGFSMIACGDDDDNGGDRAEIPSAFLNTVWKFTADDSTWTLTFTSSKTVFTMEYTSINYPSDVDPDAGIYTITGKETIYGGVNYSLNFTNSDGETSDAHRFIEFAMEDGRMWILFFGRNWVKQ
jgi:hypothetical protein